MQKTTLVLAATVVALFTVRSLSNAQEESPRPPGLPLHQGGHEFLNGHDPLNLTDQQKEQIRKINTAQAAKTLPVRNELGEKEAHLRSLMSAHDPDRAAIDRAAEEVGNMRKELFKAKIAGELKINEVLTEEQKALREVRPEGPGSFIPPPGEMGPGMR